MEDPGFNDGSLPTADAGALTRVTRFDVSTGTATAQYAYPLDPITAPNGEENGLSDLVALDDDNFLVIERSHGTHNVARIYRAGIAEADNVLGKPSLRSPPTAMTKSLVADLSTMPRFSIWTTSRESRWVPSCQTAGRSWCSSPMTSFGRADDAVLRVRLSVISVCNVRPPVFSTPKPQV